MGVKYNLNVLNNSTQLGNICVYQSDPNVNNPKVMSLAWFSKTVAPQTKAKFTWTVDYSFVWSETGELIPGVIFDVSQEFPADLSTTNQVTFTNTAGAFMFTNQTAGPNQGSLYVMQDKTIPSNAAAVGIGMSGAGTFAVPSQPNMTLIFSPHPKYWVTFGTYEAGEVLDITAISKKAEIKYPVNVYTMTATFQEDNTWTVGTTAAANQLFVQARKINDQARWGAVA